MEYIKGWKFETEESANDAVQLCNTYYGIPTPLNPQLVAWCAYNYDGTIWYISYDETIEVVLGEPIEFEINIEQ
jgi:hypothetical protein